MQWTIGKRLGVGFGLLCGVIAVFGIAAVWRNASNRAQVDRITVITSESIERAAEIRYHVSDLMAAARQVVIATAKTDQAALEETSTDIDSALAGLRKATGELIARTDDEDTRRRCREIQRNIEQWAEVASRIQEFGAKGLALEAAEASDAAKGYGEAAQRLAQEVLDAQEQRLTDERETATSAYRAAQMLTLVMLVVSAGVAGGVFLSIRGMQRQLRHVARQLREGAEQVAAAAGQVAVSSQSLSQGASQQAASLEETSASIEEMASMTRLNAERSEQTATLMTGVSNQVSVSDGMLAEMVRSMEGIRESSGKVARIIKTIDEIAFQTNILALNAAVEAARAGEAGMGFAVVADEVRSLAQRAAQAARDTASLIEDAAQSAEAGGTKVQQVAAAMSQFATSVGEVKGIADEVSQASRQQAHGIDQVTRAITDMERVTQTTAATAEESAAASQQLHGQAETTMQLVRELDALVGGAPARSYRLRRAGGLPAGAPSQRPSRAQARRRRSQAENVLPLLPADSEPAEDAQNGTWGPM
ncbi:MAG: MCP four helix bundle domain-containing protein [Vicinamibacteraceae bacterium]|nr:MCP four helix bundle domain-containing protein [Vicinamibacteraceae bacterium]